MGMSESEESQAKGNDFAEITDVREYRPGDRIKDIHWKLSAKKETLMVKERTSVAQSQVYWCLICPDKGTQWKRFWGLLTA